MLPFEIFKEALLEALHHLHDPEFEPAAELRRMLGCPEEAGVAGVQARVLEAIKAMQPTPDTPQDSRPWRDYASLFNRFVIGLTQEETAELLSMSVRNLQRVQAEAVHVLARNLWQQKSKLSDVVSEAPVQTSDWRSQTEAELAWLRMRVPNAQARVADVLNGVIDLETALAPQRSFAVRIGHVQSGLAAAVHPVVLRQTLVTAIASLVPHLASDLRVYATLEDGRVKLTFHCRISGNSASVRADVMERVLVSPEMTLSFQQKGAEAFLQITMPAVGEQRVLVVEDNPDMIHFYRRCTAGTQYSIVACSSPGEIFEAVEHSPPDIIVIDVMLPDTDGWQLLTHLRQRETTRHIPVIVCSVVRERELALALGATEFLSKPVHPRQFVEALDQALAQA